MIAEVMDSTESYFIHSEEFKILSLYSYYHIGQQQKMIQLIPQTTVTVQLKLLFFAFIRR